MNHNANAGFLRDILERPDDTGLRLIYADFLEEHGAAGRRKRESLLAVVKRWTKTPSNKPGGTAKDGSKAGAALAEAEAYAWAETAEARAELIRVQVRRWQMDEAGEGYIDPYEGHTCVLSPCPVCVAVAEYNALRAREQTILLEHGHHWLEGIGFKTVWLSDGDVSEGACYEIVTGTEHGSSIQVDFARGFVQSVACSATNWLRHAKAIRRRQPVQQVRLTTWRQTEMDRVCRDWFLQFGGNKPRIVRLVSDMLSDLFPGIAFQLPPLSQEAYDFSPDLGQTLSDPT